MDPEDSVDIWEVGTGWVDTGCVLRGLAPTPPLSSLAALSHSVLCSRPPRVPPHLRPEQRIPAQSLEALKLDPSPSPSSGAVPGCVVPAVRGWLSPPSWVPQALPAQSQSGVGLAHPESPVLGGSRGLLPLCRPRAPVGRGHPSHVSEARGPEEETLGGTETQPEGCWPGQSPSCAGSPPLPGWQPVSPSCEEGLQGPDGSSPGCVP